MKLTNIILAILTGLITLAAIVGAFKGATHHIATALLFGLLTLLLIADAKKITK